MLFAVGGLALAAGALSLVRLTPEAGIGGSGTAEAEPRLDPGSGAEQDTNAVATVAAAPTAAPSATSVMGGVSATPSATSTSVPVTAGPSSRPTYAAPAVTPGSTTIPEAPNTPAPETTAPQAPHGPEATPAAPAPQPTPTAGRSTAPSATPRPVNPGLCVPIVGLCVGGSGQHG
ncbi:hypothetical protein ACWCQ1_16775 [Streptomyces sp. NPDC002144]